VNEDHSVAGLAGAGDLLNDFDDGGQEVVGNDDLDLDVLAAG